MSAPSATTPTGDCHHPDDDRDSRKRKQHEGETKDEWSERKRAKKVRKEERHQRREAEEAEREQEEAARRKKTERQQQEFKELERVELRKELGESDGEENVEGESDKKEEVGVVLDDGNECDYCRKHAQRCIVVSGARACTTCKLKKTKCSLLPVTWVNRRVEACNRKTSGKPGSKGDNEDNCGNNNNNNGDKPDFRPCL
ncbi:hypothetical protein C8J57DRAFT_1532135 [Mycena rebaudengoi]|nr:hypothetical protein C8J57DRAFT_1532135 [Mycena rebaudengoi]